MSESSAGADRRLPPNTLEEPLPGATEPGEDKRRRHFFEFAGPLFSVAVSPVSSIVRVGATKELRALPRRWWTDKDAGKGHAHGELKSARLVRYFDGKILKNNFRLQIMQNEAKFTNVFKARGSPART